MRRIEKNLYEDVKNIHLTEMQENVDECNIYILGLEFPFQYQLTYQQYTIQVARTLNKND